LRIISDGTVEGTQVTLDGEEVRDVTAVSWHFSPKQRKTTVTLEISNVKLDAMQAVSDGDRSSLTAAMKAGRHSR
jgi:hypothetical protein